MKRVGRGLRLAATGLVGAAVLAGSVAGGDQHFPFGPFRMYATTDRVDAPVSSTRLDAMDATGRTFVLSEHLSGLRRAEIEGQLHRFRAEPSLLGAVAEAYRRRQPRDPPLDRITVIARRYALRDGRPTGAYEDRVVATWRRG